MTITGCCRNPRTQEFELESCPFEFDAVIDREEVSLAFTVLSSESLYPACQELPRVISSNVFAKVAEGGNSTVLAFGQTGSGKTHTIREIAEGAPQALFMSGAREVRVSCIELGSSIYIILYLYICMYIYTERERACE